MFGEQECKAYEKLQQDTLTHLLERVVFPCVPFLHVAAN